MDLLLNNILNLTKEEIQNSKIEFNMQAGNGGQPFLDRWLKHSEDEKMSGTCTDCSYWGWYGKQRNFYPGQWVFSFARMTDDEWLLISAAEIVDVPADEWATVNVLGRFVPLFGRLIIKCKKGNTFSRYVFNLSSLEDLNNQGKVWRRKYQNMYQRKYNYLSPIEVWRTYKQTGIHPIYNDNLNSLVSQ